jgi:hypothetical protein
VKAVFAGHYHRNAFVDDGIKHYTVSSVGKPSGDGESGFALVEVDEDGLDEKDYRFFGMDEAPRDAQSVFEE